MLHRSMTISVEYVRANGPWAEVGLVCEGEKWWGERARDELM